MERSVRRSGRAKKAIVYNEEALARRTLGASDEEEEESFLRDMDEEEEGEQGGGAERGNAVTDSEEEDEADAYGGMRALTPTKKRGKRSSPRKRGASRPSRHKTSTKRHPWEKESNNSMFEAARGQGAALSLVASDWMDGYAENPDDALAEALNFVLYTAGGNVGKVYEFPNPPQDMTDGEWADLIAELVEDCELEGGEGVLMETASGRGGKDAKKFRPAYEKLWREIVKCAPVSSATEDDPDGDGSVLGCLLEFLIVLSGSKLASLRLAATSAMTAMGIEMACQRRKAAEQLEKARRQLKGRAGGEAARLEREKLEAREEHMAAMMDKKILVGCIQHRHRDVNALVASTAVLGLGQWIYELPSVYLKDEHVRYMAWAVQHELAPVRLAGLEALLPLCTTENEPKLRALVSRCMEYLICCCKDEDGDVAVKGFSLMRAITASGLLQSFSGNVDKLEVDLDGVYLEVFDVSMPLAARSEALAFFCDRLSEFDEPGERDADERPQDRIALQFSALVRLASMHAAEVRRGDGEDATARTAAVEARRMAEALWPLPQRKGLLAWDAALSLLSEEENDRVEGLEHEVERAALLGLIEKMAQLAQEEADGGRGVKADEAKRAGRSLKDFSTVLLSQLPKLITTFASNEPALCILVRLPVFVARRPPAAASPLLDLVESLSQTLRTSASDEVVTQAAASLAALGECSGHGLAAQVEAKLSTLLADVAKRAVESDSSSSSFPHRGREFTSAQALRQLQQLLMVMDPWKRLEFADVWSALVTLVRAKMASIKEWSPSAQERRRSSEEEALRSAGKAVAAGGGALLSAFLWLYNNLMAKLVDLGGLPDELGRKKYLSPEISEQVQGVVTARDDLISVLQEALSMFTDDSEEAPSPGQTVAAREAQQWAYLAANQLQAPLKLKFGKMIGLADIAWAPDAPFLEALQKHYVRLSEEAEETEGVPLSLVRPLLASILCDIENMRLRQAAHAVLHFIGPNASVVDVIKSFLHSLKVAEPRRFLEVHMAALQISYEEWADDHPEEMDRWLQLSQKLALTVGVGASRSPELKRALALFMERGMRFAMDNPSEHLLFLEALGMYIRHLDRQERDKLGRLFDALTDAFDEEAKESLEEALRAVTAAKTDDGAAAEAISRPWRVLLCFRQQLSGGPGGSGAFAALLKSAPASLVMKRKRGSTAGRPQSPPRSPLSSQGTDTSGSDGTPLRPMQRRRSSLGASVSPIGGRTGRLSTVSRLSTMSSIAELNREEENEDEELVQEKEEEEGGVASTTPTKGPALREEDEEEEDDDDDDADLPTHRPIFGSQVRPHRAAPRSASKSKPRKSKRSSITDYDSDASQASNVSRADSIFEDLPLKRPRGLR
jgi:hypothetical protein